MPDDYDPERTEERWRDAWQESDLYAYEGDPSDDSDASDGASGSAPESQDTDYIIDTPPPYPTGSLHIGHGLQWSYIDFAARYHRLVGDDVLFPQGWDCHGLPTEVKVEENHDIHRTDVPREQFRQMCVDHTHEQIAGMKETMLELGFSIDWDSEYRTMDPEYWGKTQESFVAMEESVYRDEHPVNWCPRCETAIADAEVENEDRTGTLYYVTFDGVDGEASDDIEIATTRPELLAACVGIAVDPDDERYTDRIGESFEVPLFGQEVELIADDDVDGDFGTGAVMICTFGDKQDVDWWARHDLELRPVFTEDGHLDERAGEYEGLTIPEAEEQVAEDLDEAGYLNDSEPTEQSVGQCWRCDTPIEILSKEQWFVEVDGDAILERAREVDWIPDHMYDRLVDWTEGMGWDWVISRQRVFATPIPAWECLDCGEWYVASRDEVPVDPNEDDPAVESCPECGASATPEGSRGEGGETAETIWRGETDVMDTWMDSSITPLHVSGWPDDLDVEEFDPVALRPQGHDIIRTWAFYTLLRTGELTDEHPWDTILVNGMVFGPDGNKMSKSRGNSIAPTEAIEEFSADAFRQSLALGGQPGADVQFQWKEVRSASRFLTKVWNISRFATEHVDEDTPDVPSPAYRDADRWILSRCATVADSVAEHMDEYRYDAALRELREFVWHDLADDYLELVKGRLYEGRPGERDAARHALYTTLTASLRMLSPFSPFVTEEIWDHLPGVERSIHAADWPAVEIEDPAAERRGRLVADVASAVRAWKSDEGMALNQELSKVEVYPDDDYEEAIDTYDLSETVNAPMYVREGRPSVEEVPVAVDPDHSAIGPKFRDQAGEVVAALESRDPQELRAQLATNGEIEIEAGNELLVVDGDMFDVIEELRAESGEEVAVAEGELATVLVFP